MKIERKCPVCGVIYNADSNRLKHGRQTTCGRACSYKFRGDKLSNKVGLTCATCGEEFERAPSHIKGKYGAQFCSRPCHYKGRILGLSKRVVTEPYNVTEEGRRAWLGGAKKTRKKRIARDNYGHTQETIAKLREATTRAIAEGRVPARSKIEKEVRAFMEAEGVEFFYQHPLRDSCGRYVCIFDFFIPKNGAVVEVNGTFWHSDPRFYPQGPVHKAQKRTAVRWRRKLQRIAEKGYELYVVWEHDIKERGNEYLADVLAPAVA